MDYEKKYKEIVGEIKKAYLYAQTDSTKAVLEEIFPELAESEDEKVIKEIIELVMQPTWKTEEEFHRRNVLCAWLENVPVTIDHEKREGFHLGCKAGLERLEMKTAEESLGVDSDTYNKIVDECIFGEQNDSCVKDYNNIDPHFGKSIDKTESKFKVGDWITNGQYTKLIVGINSDWPYYMFKDGTSKWIKDIDKKYHLWTIQDAKDDDVLAFKNDICGIIICKSPTDYDTRSYCRLVNDTLINKEESGWDSTLLIPATKEQCELLFTKMKEAGYEWDAEKKELIKIRKDDDKLREAICE